MLVQLNYLKSRKAVDAGPVLQALAEQVARSAIDPSHLLVRLDWIQYRKNFRRPVEPRRFLDADDSVARERELALDVRRLGSTPLATEIEQALAYLYADRCEADGRLCLEEFGRPSESVIWSFNRVFWQHLAAWETTFQRSFLDALPGGVSDGTNPDFWRERLETFLATLEDLDRRGLIPEEIFVLELGVGAGHQARIWLDTFQALCAERHRDYYQRIRYLMSDYSHDLLYAARRTIGEHDGKVSALNIDAADPLHSLSFLRYKALFIHSSNLYDNLPTHEIARRNGKLYEVRARAYLPAPDVEAICSTHRIDRADLLSTLQRFLRVGPEYFDDPRAGVHFWADVWDALRLEERYVRAEDASVLRFAPGVPSIRVEDVLHDFPGDIRMHLSTAAVRSFANTLPLLHPRGMFQAQDIFVRELDQYVGTFRGPGKLDGSVVNWVNGPLFAAVGEHLGYRVHLEPFRYREGSNVVVLTVSQKD